MQTSSEKMFFLISVLCVLCTGWFTWRHVEVLRRKGTTGWKVGMVPCDARRPFSTCTKRSSTRAETATHREKSFRLFAQVNTESITYQYWKIIRRYDLFSYCTILDRSHLSSTNFDIPEDQALLKKKSHSAIMATSLYTLTIIGSIAYFWILILITLPLMICCKQRLTRPRCPRKECCRCKFPKK